MSQPTSPTIQILDKDNYSKQYIVTLPSSPLGELAPSSLRLKSEILGLTTNNLSYARLGHILGWWDIHPLPPNTPSPYDDPERYGRISAWGYATIIESTVSSIPVGKTVYGYLPIGTLPVDVNIKVCDFDDAQLEVLDPHRQHLWKIYNRLQITDSLDVLIKEKGAEYLAWDALMQGLYGTSYNLNRYGFAWNEADLISPDGNKDTAWTMQDADLKDAIVVCLSGSGKTAMSFAHSLKKNRPENEKPKAVIAVGSEKSKAFTEKSGFYDGVALYSDDAATFIKNKYPEGKKVVLIDFGAREGVHARWSELLGNLGIPVRSIRVAGEVKVANREESTKLMQRLSSSIVVHASALREKGIERGGKTYFKEFYEAFDGFKADGGIPGTTFRWGKGMQDWAKDWDELVRDEVDVNTALVCRL